MVEIAIDIKGTKAIAKSFNAKPAQIKRASNRAISKTLKQIETKGRRAIAKAHDVPVKVLRSSGTRFLGRVIKKKFKGSTGGSVWFGNNPIKSGYLGNLRDAPFNGGAFARKFYFKGGFIAKMDSGHKGIFARTTDSRYPIEEQTVALHSARSVIKRTAKESQGLFQKILKQELNFEVNVRGKKLK